MGNCLDINETDRQRPPPLPPRNRPQEFSAIFTPPEQVATQRLYPTLPTAPPPPYTEHDPNPNRTMHAAIRNCDGHRTVRGLQRERPAIALPESFLADRISDRILIAAIDLGTTFSGYAFSFRHDFQADKLKISTNMWAHNNGLSAKAPSAILIGQDKKIVAFGYDAQLKYANLVETSQEKDYLFFEKFKLILHNNRHLNYNTRIKDIHGNEMYAMDVFGLVIFYLKNHLMERLKGQDSLLSFDVNMIHWVLTVPAIWNDKAKQFMRKAAEKAGIQSDQLTLALEPEAASLFCKTYQELVHRDQAVITGKYLLLDLGGGTVDVTAHEIDDDETLKELHQATGGAWGGTSVDNEFNVFLLKIFSSRVMDVAYKRYPNEMLELQMDFEIKKRLFEPKQLTPIAIKIPACIIELFYEISAQTVSENLQNSTMKHAVEFKRDKMLIQPDYFYNFFSNSLSSIIHHIETLLHRPNLAGIKTIVLVGGFSESLVVKEAICSAFRSLRVVNPNDCSLAVLKGAVLFGHNPRVISSRICKYTYGVAINVPFVSGEHPESKRQVIKGVAICDDIFDIHLRIGDKAQIGKPVKQRVYQAVQGESLAILEVFASRNENPRFVTEESCFELGSLIINLPRAVSNNNTVNVALHYCGTELAVVARDNNTGNVIKTTFDFLG